MQGAEEENQAKSRSDEELANFRPSPNFKHKKYLRSKFEEAMMVEANSSQSGQNKLEEVNKVVEAQPPLPPNPPPPDTPPMILNVKQEVEDEEYTCSTTEKSSDLEHLEEVKAAAATIKVDYSEEKPGVTMCRNFARGTCKKGAACIFAHELILSQLPGVYTFCRNFQNSVCSFPKCKFVHATVFEKEHFFRTGYLPPHALAHLKESTAPPQAPPPLPQSEEVTAGLPPVYPNATPTTSIPCVPPAVVQYSAEPVAEPSDPNIFNPLQSATSTITTSPKRAWSELDEVNSATGVLDSGESLAKKCKNCDSNELREQLMKAKVESCARANKERAQKIALLKKKNSLRASLIRIIFSTDGSHINGDKALAFHLLNNNSSNDWTSVLDQMLRKVESVMPPDAS
ncbi:hypothetical protein PYW08_000448 [Mythimna loreyi]|uniref:Uncharacterized protein n=1 Tax=Mythimna loreyi TaxID=667449 RepID=A0ACC2RCH2_9NEOP|nr:hypothetical protein PYW08_000448 [Mythimna loreyi]